MTDNLEVVETLSPMHPGELLREEFMNPLGLTAGHFAEAIGVPRTRIERIVAEEVGISADTALRLSRLFGVSPQYWANAQSHHDLEMAALKIAATIDRIQPIAKAAQTPRFGKGHE
jgi:addiction module HigA family antidote